MLSFCGCPLSSLPSCCTAATSPQLQNTEEVRQKDYRWNVGSRSHVPKLAARKVLAGGMALRPMHEEANLGRLVGQMAQLDSNARGLC